MKRKIITLLVSGILFGIIGQIVFSHRVFSVSLCPAGNAAYGLKWCQGYFNGVESADPSAATLVLSNGLNAYNEHDLEQVITGDLNACGACASCSGGSAGTLCQNHRGAAFIIDTMLGQNTWLADDPNGFADGVNYASGHIQQWEQLINYYCSASKNCGGGSPALRSTTGINWDATPLCGTNANPSNYGAGSINSSWFPDLQDDGFHTTVCPLDRTSQLELFWPNGGAFEIGQNCGNIEMSVASPPPQTMFSCGSAIISTGNIDPETPFVVTATINVSNGQVPPGTTMWISITPIAPSTWSYPQTTEPTAQGPPITATTPTIGPAPSGNYKVNWNLNSPNALSSNCTFNISSALRPYLRVYGGDVSVTGSPELVYNNGFTNTPTPGCEETQTQGGIFSWNNGNSGSPTYSGAGTQYAVYALGDIEGFASAQESTSSPSPPSGLAFAYPTGSGTYGGSFGAKEGQADCDFTYDCLFQTGVQLTFGGQTSCPNNEPICPANATPSNKLICPSTSIPSVIKTGESKTIFTFNSVYITNANNGITYQQTGWTSPSKIPYFRLVVLGGNIYIAPNVTELDGIYVAEPSIDAKGNKVGGTIYTCATGTLSKNQTPVVNPSSIANYSSTCGKQLQIYGSFIAEQVEFLRTYGSVGGSLNDHLNTATTPLSTVDGAEVFEYTPEVWLPRSTNFPADNYTAISGLPPVL